jgi:hypothetical protein
MLVVIGIILLLIGMSVAGFNTIAKHSKAQHTKVALETAKAMIAEYEATAGKTNLAGFRGYWDNVSPAIDVSTLPPRQSSVTILKTPLPPDIYAWDQYSALVLAKLLELPNNKAILDKLPSEQVQKTLQIPANSGNYFYEILDGYGHPILFVPSIGLAKITVNGQPGAAGATTGIMQSDGRVNSNNLPTAPNPRYFWMSCGPDNNPQTGDDNHYSFEQ